MNTKVAREPKIPDGLKLANTAPVFKKEDPLHKSNYRLMSILTLLSKVYEKVIYNQLSDYSDSFLNDVLCVFRRIVLCLNYSVMATSSR